MFEHEQLNILKVQECTVVYFVYDVFPELPKPSCKEVVLFGQKL